MNNAIIKLDWQNVGVGVTRSIVESSSSLFNCLDGVVRTTCDVVPASGPCADDEHYDVEVTVAVYMPKLYGDPQNNIVKSSILSDITNRVRSRMMTASSSYHNCDINNGLKTTILVDSWDTDQWGSAELE